MRLIFIAFIILWSEYTDHDEIFLILVLIRVPDAYIVETGNARENDGIKKYLSDPLLRRGFNTAKITAREASARFLTQYGVEAGGGGVIQTIFEEYNTENDI